MTMVFSAAPSAAPSADSSRPAPRHLLFLCTGNSARSVLAEAILRDLGSRDLARGPIVAHSAGSRPAGHPHPLALDVLSARGHDTAFARSKSWDRFAAPGAPALDYVVTLCDSAAGEVCPIWPGTPLQLHLGLDDPAAVTGGEAECRAAFDAAYDTLWLRIGALVELLDDPPAEREIRARAAAICRLLPATGKTAR